MPCYQKVRICCLLRTTLYSYISLLYLGGRGRSFSLSIAAQFLSCLREAYCSGAVLRQQSRNTAFPVSTGVWMQHPSEIAHSVSQAETRTASSYRDFSLLCIPLPSPSGAKGAEASPRQMRTAVSLPRCMPNPRVGKTCLHGHSQI